MVRFTSIAIVLDSVPIWASRDASNWDHPEERYGPVVCVGAKVVHYYGSNH